MPTTSGTNVTHGNIHERSADKSVDAIAAANEDGGDSAAARNLNRPKRINIVHGRSNNTDLEVVIKKKWLHISSFKPSVSEENLIAYAVFLSGFDYRVVYKRGIDNANADCLSRAPVCSPHLADTIINNKINQLCESTIQQISTLKLNHNTLKLETEKDSELSALLQNLKNKRIENTMFTINNGIIFRGQRVVIPAILQQLVLKELHLTHMSISKMKQLARRYVYWKSIDKDIEQLVKECVACSTVRACPPKVKLHTWEEPEQNWQRIHIDYAGPFQGYHYLVVIDAKSKWAEIGLTNIAPTSSITIEMLSDVYARHGYPDVIVSDNATIFTSDEFKLFCSSHGVFQKFIAPGHPATNGLAERNIQTLKQRLKCMTDDPRPMRKKLREILFRYRSTPLKCGNTPAELYLGRQIRIQLDTLKSPKVDSQRTVQRHDVRQLKEGERVQTRYYINNKKSWKFGTIIKKLGHLHYMIKLDDGYILKRHINQLRATRVPSHTPTASSTNTSSQDCEPDSCSPNLQDLVQVPTNTENRPRSSDSEGHNTPVTTTPRRSERQRRAPAYLNDYRRNT
ncbi:uncharacterized protein K02A2.6-like [Rhagoletis pomonella]|uniref:uncharacterized protein K02A2.6-like n=1 Tax=Rhagoletis pomonella TaxID=28610 RepID=UPI001784F35E|nr:uncharacterized protein K02A2.6-like [Rhagoletis pomonella]